jgi:hypothetical protein
MLTSTEASLQQVRRHCLQVHQQTSKAIAVTEGINFCKRTLIYFLGMCSQFPVAMFGIAQFMTRY